MLLHFATSHTGWRRDLLEVDRCIPSFASGHGDSEEERAKDLMLAAMGARSDGCEFAYRARSQRDDFADSSFELLRYVSHHQRPPLRFRRFEIIRCATQPPTLSAPNSAEFGRARIRPNSEPHPCAEPTPIGRASPGFFSRRFAKGCALRTSGPDLGYYRRTFCERVCS